MRHALVAALLFACVAARADEVWVVNEVGPAITVLDGAMETVTATIPLSGPAPSSLAFSTVEGVGPHCIVAQGSGLTLIDAVQKTVVGFFDLRVELQAGTVTVADVAAGANREYLDGATPDVRARLFVAADIAPAGGAAVPSWVVLDQEELLSGSGVDPVVATGSLALSTDPPGQVAHATGVSVFGAPRGPAFQRALFTVRLESAGGGVALREIELLAGRDLSDPVLVGRTRDRPLSTLRTVLGGEETVLPLDRELAVQPTRSDGSLAFTNTGGECVLGGEITRADIRGPGNGGYQLMALDAANGDLLRVNEQTCDHETYDLGGTPFDLTVDSTSRHGKTFVTRREQDAVSVLRLDETLGSIPLGMSMKACEVCPTWVEARRRCAGCTVKGTIVTLAGADVQLSFARVGCQGCEVAVYCQCAGKDALNPSCPCDCTPDAEGGLPCLSSLPPPSSAAVEEFPEAETPWKQLGITLSNLFTHTGAGAYTLNYVVLPVD